MKLQKARKKLAIGDIKSFLLLTLARGMGGIQCKQGKVCKPGIWRSKAEYIYLCWNGLGDTDWIQMKLLVRESEVLKAV